MANQLSVLAPHVSNHLDTNISEFPQSILNMVDFMIKKKMHSPDIDLNIAIREWLENRILCEMRSEVQKNGFNLPLDNLKDSCTIQLINTEYARLLLLRSGKDELFRETWSEIYYALLSGSYQHAMNLSRNVDYPLDIFYCKVSDLISDYISNNGELQPYYYKILYEVKFRLMVEVMEAVGESKRQYFYIAMVLALLSSDFKYALDLNAVMDKNLSNNEIMFFIISALSYFPKVDPNFDASNFAIISLNIAYKSKNFTHTELQILTCIIQRLRKNIPAFIDVFLRAQTPQNYKNLVDTLISMHSYGILEGMSEENKKDIIKIIVAFSKNLASKNPSEAFNYNLSIENINGEQDSDNKVAIALSKIIMHTTNSEIMHGNLKELVALYPDIYKRMNIMKLTARWLEKATFFNEAIYLYKYLKMEDDARRVSNFVNKNFEK